ncbi:hypothetical protein FIBSPDRAFT_963978 [Athelia psychrophila]|uniref:Kinesin motor domain-containing protein n=1 Tax=Athelia psychrophila TaxID=1759441 RepID=A0A165YDD5_9AGAM|nr:hypothetical protein FIBSPDRAFT_963978 [Fibularhizoctonia sp. CBS 109695]
MSTWPSSSISGSILSTSSMTSSSSTTTGNSTWETLVVPMSPIQEFKVVLSSVSRSRRMRSTPNRAPWAPVLLALRHPADQQDFWCSSHMRSPRGEIAMGRIDPEELLVAAATIEPGEGYISVDDIDEGSLRGSSSSNAREHDKVFVFYTTQPAHVLYKPFTSPPALSPSARRLRYTASATSSPAPSRSPCTLLVRAAMEGYNALIFAYGLTASGKTFTLGGDSD